MSANSGRRMRGPGSGPPGMMVEKPKDLKGGVKRLLNYLAEYRLKLAAVFILAGLSALFNIVAPKVTVRATDELARGAVDLLETGAFTADMAMIGRIIIVLLALYVLSGAFGYIQAFIISRVSADVSYLMRKQLMEKINRLPLSYFHKTTQGDVLSRITNDVDTLSMNLNQSVTQFISSITTVVGVVFMMLSISPLMTLLTLCVLPLSMLAVGLIVKSSQKQFKAQQSILGDINGHIEEMYGGHVVVKAFNYENTTIESFDEKNGRLYGAAWKAGFLSGLMQPCMAFIGNLGYVAICIAGAALVSAGRLTIGGIQAFLQYSRNFTQPITQMAQLSNQLQSMIAAAERVFEFLDSAEETDGEVKAKIADMDVKGDIRFEHVRFGYDPDRIIIKDFSANVKAGQKIAIVGPTGAGKTTLIKLLMRFHELDGGAIYIDGRNITDFARRDLRTEFGMVLQDTWLFSGSIMDNIRYGRPEATDAEVVNAAKAAQVDHYIKTLPDSYAMCLNEEATNVSQGQKQLLTIARAIIADARILILDEATSSVDTRTEIQIQNAMDNLMRGRTSFIIAHRLSTIKNADMILCLNDGDIVEQGTHDELMKLGGFYAKLYNSQFETVEKAV